MTDIDQANAVRRFNVRNLKEVAARWGATVEVDRGQRWTRCNIDAPEGRAWACDGSLTTLVCEWLNGDQTHRNVAIADAMQRMAYGTTAATEDDT